MIVSNKGLWVACQRTRGAAAPCLLLWLLYKADRDQKNSFIYDKEFVADFSRDMEAEFGYCYKPFTVEDALRQLIRAKAVERVQRGVYKIMSWITERGEIPVMDHEVETPKKERAPRPHLLIYEEVGNFNPVNEVNVKPALPSINEAEETVRNDEPSKKISTAFKRSAWS